MEMTLSERDWDEEFEGKCTQHYLLNILCGLIQNFVPKVQFGKFKYKCKWITKQVKDLIDAKEKTFKRLKARKTFKRVKEYRTEKSEGVPYRKERNKTVSVVKKQRRPL